MSKMPHVRNLKERTRCALFLDLDGPPGGVVHRNSGARHQPARLWGRDDRPIVLEEPAVGEVVLVAVVVLVVLTLRASSARKKVVENEGQRAQCQISKKNKAGGGVG